MEYKKIDLPDCEVKESGGNVVNKHVDGLSYRMTPYVEDNGSAKHRYFALAERNGSQVWFEIFTGDKPA